MLHIKNVKAETKANEYSGYHEDVVCRFVIKNKNNQKGFYCVHYQESDYIIVDMITDASDQGWLYTTSFTTYLRLLRGKSNNKEYDIYSK